MSVYGVTGGQGFIGSYLRRELLARGHQVVVFDRHPHTDMAAGETFFLGDVRDETAIVELAAHVEGIIHLAAVLGTQETIGNPRPSAETNIRGKWFVWFGEYWSRRLPAWVARSHSVYHRPVSWV